MQLQAELCMRLVMHECYVLIYPLLFSMQVFGRMKESRPTYQECPMTI